MGRENSGQKRSEKNKTQQELNSEHWTNWDEEADNMERNKT